LGQSLPHRAFGGLPSEHVEWFSEMTGRSTREGGTPELPQVYRPTIIPEVASQRLTPGAHPGANRRIKAASWAV
jgi:hypothetical protein